MLFAARTGFVSTTYCCIGKNAKQSGFSDKQENYFHKYK